MVLSGYQWFSVVPNGSQVPSGYQVTSGYQWLQWLSVVPNGSQWLPVVPSAMVLSAVTKWLPVVTDGSHGSGSQWFSVYHAVVPNGSQSNFNSSRAQGQGYMRGTG